MRPSVKLLIVACLLLCAQAHAQTLIYSLTYTETTASFRAHFGNVPFPWRTPEQNLEMSRQTLKTEIYGVSVADGKRTLLFSDEGPHLEIQAVGSLTRAGKAYVVAFWRDWHGQPSPGSTADRAYYEIDLDGSKQFRKVAEAPAGQGPPVLNSQATRALVQGPDETYFVYSLPDWKLLASWGLAGITQAHCPLCTPGLYGWLADGNRLYFDLDVSGDETAEEAKSDHTGVYILSASGDDLGSDPAGNRRFSVSRIRSLRNREPPISRSIVGRPLSFPGLRHEAGNEPKGSRSVFGDLQHQSCASAGNPTQVPRRRPRFAVGKIHGLSRISSGAGLQR